MECFLTTELHLKKGHSKEKHSLNPIFSNIFLALDILGELHKKIRQFGIFVIVFIFMPELISISSVCNKVLMTDSLTPLGQVLLKYMLKPLIMYPILVKVGEHHEHGIVLSLQSEENQAEHRAPAEVYTNILTVLKTLHEHLFGTYKHLLRVEYYFVV